MLTTIVHYHGQIITQYQIIYIVWNEPFIAADQVKLLVGRLRKKLAGHIADDPIETVRGFGYRYCAPGAA